ncbi:MAG: hypothetical protein K2P48_01950 [Lachnospiraceae bacterium]|nr:hypothetical protein [Lachnospiraceae bacterium]
MDETYALAWGVIAVYVIVVLAVAVISLVGMWKIFVKAGKPGWAAIVPIYNTYCLFEISFGTGWLFLLCLVPCVNVVITIIMWIKLAQAFDKGAAYGIGILFLPVVFLPMLGFSDAQYIGPVGK